MHTHTHTHTNTQTQATGSTQAKVANNGAEVASSNGLSSGRSNTAMGGSSTALSTVGEGSRGFVRYNEDLLIEDMDMFAGGAVRPKY